MILIPIKEYADSVSYSVSWVHKKIKQKKIKGKKIKRRMYICIK